MILFFGSVITFFMFSTKINFTKLKLIYTFSINFGNTIQYGISYTVKREQYSWISNFDSITASSVLDPNPNYLINTTILLCQFRSHMTFLNKTNYATVFYTAHSSFEHYRVHLHDNSCS